MPQSIHTERLVLRNWLSSDLAPFQAMGANERVMRYFPAPLTPAESRAFLERQQAHVEAEGWGFWAVEHDGTFIGFTGLARVGFSASFTPAIEVGWRLTPEAWGNGFATEAARASLAVAFERLGAEQVVSFTAAQNTPSRAVMERLGMTTNPDENFEHPRLPEGHPLRHHVLYRTTPGR